MSTETLKRARKLMVDFVLSLSDAEADELVDELEYGTKRLDIWEMLLYDSVRRQINRAGLASVLADIHRLATILTNC